MKVQEGELTMEQIIHHSEAINEIIDMDMDFEMMIDLGIIKSEHDNLVKIYRNSLNKIKIQAMKSCGIAEDQEKVTGIQQLKFEEEVKEKIDNSLNKKYKVIYSNFSRKELKELVEKTKDLNKPFKPSITFYSNMKDFII